MADLISTPTFFVHDINGKPVPGARINTFFAGTSSPAATFTDSTGAVAHSNPVICDQRGEAQIWGSPGVKYRFRVEDSGGSLLYEIDSVQGIPDATPDPDAAIASEWLDFAGGVTYISATSFSVDGDFTATFHVGRRTRSQVTGGVSYGTIDTSVFSTGVTTVTLVNDALPLDAGLSAVSYGILSADNPSASVDCIAGIGSLTTIATGDVIMHAGSTPRAGFVWCDGTAYDGNDPTYAALWGVIGNIYGGTSIADFEVPNLNGRSPVGFGQGDTAEGGGPGTTRSLGEKMGAETHTQTIDELVPHKHVLNQRDPGAAQNDRVGRVLSSGGETSSSAPVEETGGGQPHNNMSPGLGIGFQIKL